MYRHKVNKVQSILLPKDKFHNKTAAKHHIEKMGYNAHFKEEPDETLNFYRFRQHKPIAGSNYRNIKMDGVEAIIETPKTMVGMNGAGTWQP